MNMLQKIILFLLLASNAHAWSVTGGFTDVLAPAKFYIPAAGCADTITGSNWDIYATDPVSACVNGTVIKKGVLTFDDTNTCTSNTATTGCAFTTLQLPGTYNGSRVDAKLLFTSTDTTNAHTIIWTISTKCTTPTTSNNGSTDNPATLNAAQSMTYTCAASEVSASLRQVSQTSVTMTGCSAGDLLHIRIGRDISDTATTSMNFVGLELTIYQNL